MKHLSHCLIGIGVCLGLTSMASAQPSEPMLPVTPDTLLPGIYRGQGTAYNRSWRTLAQTGDRFCVEIANGPPNPYAGLIVASVSSLSLRDGQLYIDATDFPLTSGISWDGESQHVDFGPPQLRTDWRYQPNAPFDTEWLADCLASNDTYTQYHCEWINGTSDFLAADVPLPLSSDIEALVVQACQQGANTASSN